MLAMVSPGPDFAVVTRYGLSGSRRAALRATYGIAFALVIHVLYCVSGVAVVLHKSPAATGWIRGIGSLYLLYLGVKLLFDSRSPLKTAGTPLGYGAFFSGFIVNLFNPKATVFLLTLFSLFADSMRTFEMKIAYAASVPLLALLWFALLSNLLTYPRFLPWLQKKQRIFLFIMGVILAILGLSGLYSVVSLLTLFLN